MTPSSRPGSGTITPLGAAPSDATDSSVRELRTSRFRSEPARGADVADFSPISWRAEGDPPASSPPHGEPPTDEPDAQLGRERRDRRPIGVSAALFLVATITWLSSLPGIDPNAVSAIGLISALPIAYFVAVAVLTCSFVMALRADAPPRFLLAAQLALLVFMLFGTASIVEPLARFPTAWLHAGFTDYIARTGSTIPNFDARFSWPGFFSATALITRASGLSSPVFFLRFAPVLFNLAYALGVFVIAKSVTRDPRVPYAAAAIYLAGNWVGQDYYSPQATAYLLALVFMAILLRFFRTPAIAVDDSRGVRRLWRRCCAFAPDEHPQQATRTGTRCLLLALILATFAAIVVSHQLTPAILIVSTIAIVIVRRTSLTFLPFVLLAMFILWISFGAEPYWSGHLADLFGGIGQLGSSVSQNLAKRVSGDPSRIFVQRVRIGMTIGVLLVAAVGVLRRLRVGFGDLTLILLALSPFTMLALQSYGGEALLRAAFFSLPYAAVLAAFAIFPAPGHTPTWRPLTALLAVLLALMPLFLIARYGNEAWDMQTPTEHRAFTYVYDHAPRGAALVSVVSEVPWAYRDLEKYEYLPRSETKIMSGLGQAQRVFHQIHGPAYLIVTRSQVAFGHLFGGLPENWGQRLVDQLLATGEFKLVYQNPQSIVLLRPAHKDAP